MISLLALVDFIQAWNWQVTSVLAMLNRISLHGKVTKQFIIRKDCLLLMTSQKSKMGGCSRKLTSGVSGRLAPISAWPAIVKVSMAKLPQCSSKLCDFLTTAKKYASLHICSWKTLRISYQAMEDGTLPKSSFKWTKQGMMSSGKSATQKKLSHKTENASSLLGTSAEEPLEEYFH